MVYYRFFTHLIALIGIIIWADICLLFAILVKVFDPVRGWKLSCWIANVFWSYMQNHFEVTLNASQGIKVTGDELPYGGSAIVLTNHLTYADFYLSQHIAVKTGMLSSSRYFVKRSIVWMIPLFGWAFWAMDMILVSRNWTKDEKSISNVFSRILLHGQPIYIALSPEGTRLTPPKLLSSQAYSRQHNKPILKHLLWPRTKGFVATVMGLKGKSQVKWVYDYTFLYLSPSDTPGRHQQDKSGRVSGNGVNGRSGKGRSSGRFRVPSLGELLGCKDLYKQGYGFRIHVRKFSLDDLPNDENGLKEWCERMWIEKDEILGKMIKDEESNTGSDGQSER